MTPEVFAEHFHFMADAPNGVQKLREMILQLAVHGKLVSQDPEDEPASVLLKKIRAEKERLIKEGKIRKQKALPPIDSDQMPYQLPVSWLWVRLGDVTNYGTADRVEPGDVADGTWTLELGDIEKTTSRLPVRVRYPEREFKSTKNVFAGGNVLYGKLRPYLDKVLVADEPGICTTEIIPIHGYGGINPFYLRIVLKAPDFIAYANSSTHGMNLPRLGTDKARLAAFALAPLAEQKRIVAKVGQLMALCDELEDRQQRRAENRITLNSACLNALTSPDGDSVRKAWQRIRENFDLLYDCPENVSVLRQAILQLAVQGKLVPQDPQDEPASVLLKKIRAEKERLIKEGKIKKQKPLPPIDPNEVPYELPKEWEWARLGTVAEVLMGQSPPGTSYNETGEGVPLINGPVEFSKGSFGMTRTTKFTTQPTKMCEAGDLLVCVRGATTGRTNIASEDCCIGRGVAAIRPYIHDRFMQWFMVHAEKHLLGIGTGSTFPSVSYVKIVETLFPLPPFAEQERIVAKLDQLMVLCDELEAKLKQSQSAAETLMGAVVSRVTAA